MADDKGGGSEWGVLEIVLVIVLVIGALDRLTGTSPSRSTTPSSAPIVVQEDPSMRCGLSLDRPSPKETVRTVVSLRGTVGSCNWLTTESVALYAQIVDAKGKSVSSYIAVPPLVPGDTNDSVAFDASISLTASPAKGTGYLILVPAVQPPTDQTISTRIPLSLQ